MSKIILVTGASSGTNLSAPISQNLINSTSKNIFNIFIKILMHPALFLGSFIKYPTKIIAISAQKLLLIIIIYYFRRDFNITPS